MNLSAKNQKKHIDIYEHLYKSPLFINVSPEVIKNFADAARLKMEPKGRVLFINGDKSEWFYLIINGWVKLFHETVDGTEVIVNIISDGSIFGENSVLNKDSFDYSAQTVEQTNLIMLPSILLKNVLANDRQISLNMLSQMAEYNRKQNRHIEHLNAQNASQRIGCFLLHLHKKHRPPLLTFNLPYDKSLIASNLGMKPETFSRAIVKLENKTGTSINGTIVNIENLQKLIDYTCNQCSGKFSYND
ncbi:MAG: Crp/Fnr family transcriptional regulator [Rickettsiales bacterium]